MSAFLIWAFGVLAGAAVAWLALARRFSGVADPTPSPEPAPVPAPAAPPAELPPPAAESAPAGDLASQLYPLREAIERFADSAAHPREIENREEFRQAVALLADASVPLDVVADYALGNNWALSSAAFAAFGTRPDRQAALDLVLPRLPNIGAWPLYFALAYVDALPE